MSPRWIVTPSWKRVQPLGLTAPCCRWSTRCLLGWNGSMTRTATRPFALALHLARHWSTPNLIDFPVVRRKHEAKGQGVGAGFAGAPRLD